MGALPLLASLAITARNEPGGIVAALGKAFTAASTLRALDFGLRQAAISSLVALLIGLPGAWIVARLDFPGRKILGSLGAVPFCVPPILIVLAFVLYYGRNGYFNRFLMGLFNLPDPPIGFLYSFWGLVFVHGFYNFPIILSSVAEVWERLPQDRDEAARLLGARQFKAFITGSLPSLAPAIAQASALVFLFSFFSFVVVLVFGPLGGTTLEVEIFRRARHSGDLSGAAALGLIETSAALIVVAALALAERRDSAAIKKAGAPLPRNKPLGYERLALISYLAFILIFFVGPIIALIAESLTVRRGMGGKGVFGFGNFVRLAAAPNSTLIGSVRDTLSIALPAALIATLAGGLVAFLLTSVSHTDGEEGKARLGMARTGDNIALALLSLPLAVSGLVTALGWSFLGPRAGVGVIIIAEALTALPFVTRNLMAALSTLERSPIEAARTLGASSVKAFLTVQLPAIASGLVTAAAFAFAMAAGDANAPLLLGKGEFEPLPLLVYRLVGAYRFPEACAAGVVLAFLTGLVFFLKDRESLHA